MIGSIRVPTAATHAASDLGLGAWEFVEGLVLERSVTARLQLALSAEVGVRASDTWLGVDRRLGPRLSTQLMAWYWTVPDLALGVSASLVWEGDRALADEWQAGTGSRQGVIGAGAVYRPRGSHFRPALAVRHAPPVPGLVVNAASSTTFELSLAYAR
jgi:hypothetical protein